MKSVSIKIPEKTARTLREIVDWMWDNGHCNLDGDWWECMKIIGERLDEKL